MKATRDILAVQDIPSAVKSTPQNDQDCIITRYVASSIRKCSPLKRPELYLATINLLMRLILLALNAEPGWTVRDLQSFQEGKAPVGH